jgi:hypothetical protein
MCAGTIGRASRPGARRAGSIATNADRDILVKAGDWWLGLAALLMPRSGSAALPVRNASETVSGSAELLRCSIPTRRGDGAPGVSSTRLLHLRETTRRQRLAFARSLASMRQRHRPLMHDADLPDARTRTRREAISASPQRRLLTALGRVRPGPRRLGRSRRDFGCRIRASGSVTLPHEHLHGRLPLCSAGTRTRTVLDRVAIIKAVELICKFKLARRRDRHRYSPASHMGREYERVDARPEFGKSRPTTRMFTNAEDLRTERAVNGGPPCARRRRPRGRSRAGGHRAVVKPIVACPDRSTNQC